MITCPWCGTNYTSFQPNCDNCGGSLPLPPETAPTPSSRALSAPPPAPRNVPRRAVWRILFGDGWTTSALVSTVLGFVFTAGGLFLTVSEAAAPDGVRFAGLGLVFLCGGLALLVWRCRVCARTIEVLREGEATLGEIVSVVQSDQARVDGRYPWTVEYDYEVGDDLYSGKVTTLSQPDLSQQPGSPVYVLFTREDPAQSTIYPSPYGYYGI
jgi:hypothetical protein